MKYYQLNGRDLVEVEDVLEWAEWFENGNIRVAQTDVTPDTTVSTIFMGINRNPGSEPPLLFETMVFGGELDGLVWRYATYDEAETGHQTAVKEVEDNL